MWRSKSLVALAVATLVVGALSIWAKAQTSNPPTPIGPWFGIARPCTPGTRFPTPPGSVDQNVCREACLGSACPASNFPVDEVTMIPTILADGTVLADDFAELLDHHSTAQGTWEYAGKAVISGKASTGIRPASSGLRRAIHLTSIRRIRCRFTWASSGRAS
jgi:hypothetical protein